MDKEINSNGHSYVDLGLPSSTLWATCNVGANKPSNGGLYFAWGDTKGYTKEQTGTDKLFDWDNYKFSINGSDSNFSKYTNPGETLGIEDDSVHVHMGGDWHMPTYSQILELIYNTTSERKTFNGVNGRLFISKKDNSKSIFIPAVGYASSGSVLSSGAEAGVWSSMLHISNASYGDYLYSNLRYAYVNSYYRCCGFPVRGVIG